MKYAFIALIACYLLVYGCGPDNSKKAEKSKEQTVHSTVEKPLQPAQPVPATQPQKPAKEPVAAAVDTPQPAQQTAAAAPPSHVIGETGQQGRVVAEEQKPGGGAQELQPPCPMMVPRQGAVELTQPDENNIVVMPCGCMFIKHQIPANAPCLKQQGFPCPMMDAKQSAAEEELIMMPCGRIFVRQPPVDDAGLELPQESEMPCQDAVQSQATEQPEEDLATAVKKMAEATNDMVLVTQQLLVATQEMLKATKTPTGEVTNAKKDNTQAEPTAQSAKQAAEAGTKKQSAVGEQEVVDALKDAVIATQRAIELMDQSVPKAMAPKQ